MAINPGVQIDINRLGALRYFGKTRQDQFLFVGIGDTVPGGKDSRSAGRPCGRVDDNLVFVDIQPNIPQNAQIGGKPKKT